MRFQLALGALLLSTAPFAAAQEKKDAPNYFPLEVGNAWHYRLTVNGKQVKDMTRITKLEKAGDEMLARLDRTGALLFEHLKQTDEGVFRVKLNGADNKPAFRLLAYPPTVGAKWQGEFAYGKEPAKHKYSGEIQKVETVEVPAGKFETLRVVIAIEEKDRKIETVYWFANNVGFVKQTYEIPGTTYVLELEKFERKK